MIMNLHYIIKMVKKLNFMMTNYNLKDYIEEKGYSKAGYYIAIDVIIIILCICINGIRKKIASDIDLFDKQMIEDVKEKSL